MAVVAVGGARAESVARGVHEGMLALNGKGTPFVAHVRSANLVVSTRAGKGRWRAEKAAALSKGWRVMAFRVGPRGPVALVQSGDSRTIALVRKRPSGWQRIRIAGRVPASMLLGWPGLTLDASGLPVVAYTRWSSNTLNTQLLLVRVDAKGRTRSQRITSEGFPQSYVPPPAAPVIVRGRVHVVESYGYRGTVGTIEWYPDRKTWTGNGLDVGLGDFPVGPVHARAGPGGTIYAAWTQSMLGVGAVPVTLAVRAREARSAFVLDRAFTTALALPPSGPEIAANEWIDSVDLQLEDDDFWPGIGDHQIWMGTVVRGPRQVGLDGWVAGLAGAPAGARDVLLARPGGLNWFRSPRQLSTQVSIFARAEGDGSVSVSGRVVGVDGGSVTIYREVPGSARVAAGRASLAGGAFSFVDRSPVRPVFYRAVYTDPTSGIPFSAVLRRPVR